MVSSILWYSLVWTLVLVRLPAWLIAVVNLLCLIWLSLSTLCCCWNGWLKSWLDVVWTSPAKGLYSDLWCWWQLPVCGFVPHVRCWYNGSRLGCPFCNLCIACINCPTLGIGLKHVLCMPTGTLVSFRKFLVDMLDWWCFADSVVFGQLLGCLSLRWVSICWFSHKYQHHSISTVLQQLLLDWAGMCCFVCLMWDA